MIIINNFLLVDFVIFYEYISICLIILVLVLIRIE